MTKPDHVYLMKSGERRLVVNVYFPGPPPVTVTYHREEGGRFPLLTLGETCDEHEFEAEVAADLGPVDVDLLF